MFADVINLLHNPALWKLVGAYVVFMAFSQALPDPKPETGMLYRFFYGFVHALSVNLKNVAEAVKLPGAPHA